MPYNVNKYNGTLVAVVEDGTIDNSLDIKLIGKNYAGYGEVQNENLVHLLENFAGTSEPPRKIVGQIWYDSNNKKLKFYDGLRFKISSGAEVANLPPAGLAAGDFWFNSVSNQLFAWNGNQYVLVGPQAVENAGTTQMRSRNLVDTNGASQPVVEAISNNQVIYIISSTDFVIDSTVNLVPGFDRIRKGLTLINTQNSTNGQTSTDHYFWGTASNSLKFDGRGVADFVLQNQFAKFNDTGFTVGNDDDLAIYVESGTIPVIENKVGNTITFKTTSSGTKIPLRLIGTDCLPGTTEVTNLGSSALKFLTVFANTFNGKATQLDVSGIARIASLTSAPDTIAVRDSNQNITASRFIGLADRSTNINGGSSGAVPYQNAESQTQFVNIGTAGQVLTSDGSKPVWTTLTGLAAGSSNLISITDTPNQNSAFFIPFVSGTSGNQILRTDSDGISYNPSTNTITANRLIGIADRATNINGGANGAIPYQATQSQTDFVNIGAAGAVLSSDGVKPVWSTAANTSAQIVVTDTPNQNSVFFVPFVSGTSGNQILRTDSNGMSYNPSTNTLTASVFNGTAVEARYADLAEKYLTDQDYAVGTVVAVGGNKEVTAATEKDRAIGVISANPAYLMNSELENGVAVALKGRVPVQVIGEIEKGDFLVSSHNGSARKVQSNDDKFRIFAIALESNSSTELKNIECVIF